MIAGKFRIPRRDIDYILKKGELKHSKLFIIRYIENKEDFCRYRVIVSTRLHKKAVPRNRLRRQIYEAIRLNPHEQRLTKKDIILIPKKAILETTYNNIEKDIKGLLA